MEAPDYSPYGTTNPEITDIYNSINNMFMNPSVIIILVIVIILYLVIFMSLGSSNSDDSSSSSSSSSSSTSFLTVFIIALFIVLAVINGMQYLFGINIIASIKNLFSPQPEININVTQPLQTTVPELKLTKQVFNIPGNKYSYSDAKALCTAYGANLASYSQIEDSYKDGAEWCNYGWSDGQMALFPTQQKTFDGLQKISGHENDCGRPGINGGYMANPELKFGVNCYGYKPVMTSQEQELMQILPHYPITMKDILFEKRVNYWKDRLNQILVSPFNFNTWSKI
jgi:Extracellular link domain